MKHLRRAARQDSNQAPIVKALRDIPGVTVELNHNDFLVGYKKRTYWVELKNPDRKLRNGKWKKNALQPDQERLLKEFTGHYILASSLDEILAAIGIS